MRWEPRVPLVPWSDIEASDLTEANNGEPEMYRDTHDGKPERQLGLHIVGQYDPLLSLGLIALRCERHGTTLIPISMAIAETPPFVDTRQPVLAGVQSNPRRTMERPPDYGEQ